jgi:hypothetical protein
MNVSSKVNVVRSEDIFPDYKPKASVETNTRVSVARVHGYFFGKHGYLKKNNGNKHITRVLYFF